MTNTLDVQVLPGNKIIEVRIKGINKGNVVTKIHKEQKFHFILACGDDKTDEEMLKILAGNKKAICILPG